MTGAKITRVIRLLVVGVVVVFSFGAAGEICGAFFETTAAAFGAKYPDNKPEDIRKVLTQVRKAEDRTGKPENSRGVPVAVMVTEATPRAIVGMDLKSGKELWKVTIPIRSEITLGGDLAIFRSTADIVALGIGNGKEMWRYEIDEGWDYHGADVEDDVAAISIGVGGQDANSYANGRLLAFNAQSGSKIWEHGSGGGLIGEPLVIGGLVLAPWDRQKIVVIDIDEGEEVCRLLATDYTINYLEANPNGVYFGSAATGTTISTLFRLDEAAATGTREGSTAFIPSLEPVPGDPGFKRDAFDKPVAGRSGREKIRFHWRPGIPQPNTIVMADDQFYLHYWRYIIAFDSKTSQVKWVHRSDHDIESMSAAKDGVFGAESEGRVFFLNKNNGQVAWNKDTGHKVLSAVFDANGFNPSSGQDVPADPLIGLKEMIWDKDNRMLPIRSYAAFMMAAFPNPEVTRDLLQVYSDGSTPKGLRDTVVKALEKRTVGAEYLVDALHMRYDYLEQTQSPPMNVVAPALVNMSERTAVPGLLSHLMNHETSVSHLVAISIAIRELGDPSVVGTLRQFLTLYHADSSFLEYEDALAIAAEGILKYGNKADAEPFVINIRDDSQTLPELKLHLRRLIDPVAAAKADAEAKAKLEAEANAKAQAEANARAAAEAAARIPDALNRQQISKTIASQQHVLKPCVQAALGQVPTLQSIRLRFVITGSTGKASDLRTLPNNISGLRECLENGLSVIDFPHFRNLRQMATYTIRIRAGALPPGGYRPQATPGKGQDLDSFGGAPAPAPGQPSKPQPTQPVDPDAF
ncbi:MAG: PQQ-binding-like beta-propeller repeat protein [Deltaproteobacteria bacterium]|nr:PQQ-binding-like beta-propeller repeat protein [Deltaproteobacteria bacterium]